MLIGHLSDGDSTLAVNVSSGGMLFMGAIGAAIGAATRSGDENKHVIGDWCLKVGSALLVIGSGLIFGFYLLQLLFG